jgi:hypothetical protein
MTERDRWVLAAAYAPVVAFASLPIAEKILRALRNRLQAAL